MSKQKNYAAYWIAQIEHRTVPIERCVPHPRNPRQHPSDQISDLRASYRRFGQFRSLVGIENAQTQGNVWIAAGCGTLAAMNEEHAPMVDIGFLPPETPPDIVEGIMVADNNLSNKASDDDALLAQLIQEQQDAGFDLASLGSDDETLRQMLESLGDGYLGGGEQEEEEYSEDEEVLDASGSLFSNEIILAEAFKHWRNLGFPYRKMPLYLCMQELNKLANSNGDNLLHTTLGYHIADTYHPHRFHASAEGMKSPLEAYHNDNLFMRSMRIHQEMGRGIPLDVLQYLVIVSGTQACANFRPGFALYLYRKYCKSDAVVLDTSTGYGGRLIGFIASGLAGKYIGIDPNIETHQANLRMTSDLQFSDKVELYNLPAEDVPHEKIANRCDFAFTSPPYFAKEHYSDEDTQSWKRYSTGDAWRKGFLQRMLALQFVALKHGSVAIVNIADVKLRGKTYPLTQWTIEDGRLAGFEYIETLEFPLQRRFGSGQDDEVATEPVIVFRKPSLERVEVPAHA